MAYISRLAIRTMKDITDNAISQKDNPWGPEEKKKYQKFALSNLDSVKSNAESILMTNGMQISSESMADILRKIGDAHTNFSAQIRLAYSK